MYLKSIEIVGFKSFAEKTRIDLKPGITGIIGPNGCGKSNIMESIRWSIGEMSWKSLRSESMVSVIFAGTARRSPMSLASVTLTFDNAQSLLPVQYSEVSVSRRIYRSGESEYWMNKTQCRLRDIRELFLDTGIGNDGYAIIDQGGVDFVLSSKPEDRRALFEEAAGVAKYKAKREDALRKLDRVEIDVARLQDSISLINEQVKKLDSDARKAQLFQKYKIELTAMEAGQILQEVSQIETDIAAESERAAPVSEKLAVLKTELEAEGARLAAINLERSAQENAVLASNQKIAQAKSETGRLEERIENARASCCDIQTQLAASRKQMEEERASSKDMDPDIDRALAACREAQRQMDAAHQAEGEFTDGLSRLEEELKEGGSRQENLRARLLGSADGCQQASRRLSSAESALGQIDFQVRQTLKEHEKNSIRAQSARAEAQEGFAAAAAQKTALEEARQAAVGLDLVQADIRAKLEEINVQTLRLHAEAAQAQAAVAALEAQGGKDPYWVGAYAVVGAKLPGIVGTVRSLLEVPDSLRAEVSDALGERLHAVVCENSAAAKAGIQFLKDSGRGRARFLIASSLSEGSGPGAAYPPDAKPLLEQVQCAGGYEKVLYYLIKESYMLGGALFGDHWVSGGASESKTAQFTLSDLGTLKSRRASLESEQSVLLERKAALEKEAASTDGQRKAAEVLLQEAASKWHASEAQLRQREESIRLYEEEAAALVGQAARLLSEMARVMGDILELQGSLSSLQAQEQSLRAEEASASKAYESLREKTAASRLERDHRESLLKNMAAHRDVLKDQLNRLASGKEALERSIQRRLTQESQWEQRLQELELLDAEAKTQLDSYRRDLAALENEASALLARLQDMQTGASALETALSAKKKESDGLYGQLHASELKSSGLRSRADFLKGRLLQEWQLTWEEAQTRYRAQPVDSEKLQFLRRRIAALGNVNMAAPEEHGELTKRRDYLQGQVNDLLQAKEDLRSAIAKINATTRENFRHTFAEVREHFRKLYGILFEGGEADLLLTDQENLLESGVEIVAQPPGKKLQSISQLSGGEKTLTAIALLFAFFMVKPSPMCMLDEADAALDDANVDRFVSLLREFGGKTQFLIVSHNKKTMEACDVIYGITMEESGVSQVMSVDFRKKDAGAQPASSTERSAEPDGSAAAA